MKIDVTLSSLVRLVISIILNLHWDISWRQYHLAPFKRLHERVEFFTRIIWILSLLWYWGFTIFHWTYPWRNLFLEIFALYYLDCKLAHWKYYLSSRFMYIFIHYFIQLYVNSIFFNRVFDKRKVTDKRELK